MIQDVYISAWGEIEVSELPKSLSDSIQSAPKRKDGGFDMRFKDNNSLVISLDDFMVKAHERKFSKK